MRKLITILLIGFTPLLLLQVIGCEGISGPRGQGGDQGDQGDPYKEPVPDNRFFSLAVSNNSLVSHNGAPKLYLAFDTLHSAAGDTVVCRRLASGQVPSIDGIDGGSAEWGDRLSKVKLYKAAGSTNLIDTAQIRAAYDRQFVYFQVRWTEVADAQLRLQAGENKNPHRWINPATDGSNPKRWQLTGDDEDRVLFLFEVTKVTWFDHDGCFMTCHTPSPGVDLPESNYHSTLSGRERMDVWSWGAASTDSVGCADDKFMDNSSASSSRPSGGINRDLGTPVTRPNRNFFVIASGSSRDTTDKPFYQHVDDPNKNAGYPLWDYQITGVSDSSWDSGSTVPSFITSMPSGSAADVVAKGKFDAATMTWTVEFRRARVTGNGDDTKF